MDYIEYKKLLDRVRGLVDRKFGEIFSDQDPNFLLAQSYKSALEQGIDDLETEIDETISGRLDALASEEQQSFYEQGESK